MQKQSARIKCKNNLIKPMRSIKTQADNPVGLRPHDVSYCLTRPQTCRVVCPCSKQPRTIKTLIYNDIFQIFKVQKKVQSPVKQFKELFSLVCCFFARNLPSSALNYLKTALTFTNQNGVIFLM